MTEYRSLFDLLQIPYLGNTAAVTALTADKAKTRTIVAFAAKGNGKSWIVDPSDPVTRKVWEMVKKCHIALGCRHYSLFDFRIDPQGNP
jgi:D-alanine-D-alanine ligase-like ATP-grasp enzyme